MDAGSSSNSQSSAGEVAELKRELANVHRALMLQSDALARQQQRAGDLELRLANRNASSDKRLQARDQQLATLVHALLILEAKLKRDQKTISLQFQTKNAQIIQQREQIKKLKQEAYCKNCQHLIGSTSEQTNIETDPEFHSLESVETHNSGKFERSLSYQEKQKNARLSKTFQLPKSGEPNQQGNTSSSEEVFENGEAFSQSKGNYVKNKQAFVRKDVTRRSRKYSGRRQNSAYLDSVQKKDRNQASSSSAEDGAQSEKDSKVGNSYDVEEEITKDIEKTSNRIDELLNGSQSSETCMFNDSVQLRLQKTNNRHMSLSNKIDSLHGIRKDAFQNKESMESDKPWYNNISDPEPEIECHYSIKREKQKRYRYKSADDILTATFNDTDANTDVNSNNIPSEYLPTPKTNENDNEIYKTNESVCGNNEPDYCSVSNSIKDEASSNKFDNEPSENWYASASDQDDDQSCGIYKNNPVLECVNQILLQNNLDESSSDNQKNHETSPKASTKRVQFSTLNSISFEEHIKRTEGNIKEPKIRGNNKIVKFSLETASEHSYEVPNTSEGFNYEIQSIYSNDYEPILTKPSNIVTQKSKLKPVPLPRMINDTKKPSLVKNMAMNLEHKMNGNHYVDMDKFGGTGTAVNKKKTPRVPPALPPKPKNLVSKFKALPVVNAILNSDAVESSQRIADVPNAKVKQDTSTVSGTEPDYCSISEINVPVNSNKNGVILSQTTVEIHAEQFSPNIAERRPQISKVATISKITPNKISDKDIPKLPQVTEIIIPDDDEDVKNLQPRTLHDNFVKKPSNPKIDNRNSIQMGHSVSSILTDIKNRSVGIEDVNKCILSTDNRQQQYPNVIYQKANILNGNDKPRLDSSRYEVNENDAEKFDLSQNFEEFKIDDCEFTNIALAEEYKISSGDSTDSNHDDSNTKPKENFRKVPQTMPTESLYKIELIPDDETDLKIPLENGTLDNSIKTALKNYSKMSNKPDLLSNIENLETDSVRYSDLESSNSSSSNCGSYNTVKCEPSPVNKSPTDSVTSRQNISVPFEYFLESSGLSSKSILTPSRPPNSNHKNVLKPKDIKMRSKNTTLGRATPLYEKCSNTAIKYFEPYL